MSKIVVSAAGWCEADPEKVRFELSNPAGGKKEYITGAEWLRLPEYHDNQPCRDDYFLESIAKAFDGALAGEYDYVEVEVQQ